MSITSTCMLIIYTIYKNINTMCKMFLENMIRGLDDDEVDFLELVDKTKMAEERRQLIEDSRQIKEFRSKVSTLQCEIGISPLVATIPKPITGNSSAWVIMMNINTRVKMFIKMCIILYYCIDRTRKTQSKLLAGAIVKKRTADESINPSKKQKSTVDECKKLPKKSTGQDCVHCS